MELIVKEFNELTTEELYKILQARVQVFVVEQECTYQDIDDIDYRSLHLFYMNDGQVEAYLRVFDSEDEPGTVQIGRVLTTIRGKGYGIGLLTDTLEVIKRTMNPSRIYLAAQCYAIDFYARAGFKVCTEMFLEDGIEHVGMELISED